MGQNNGKGEENTYIIQNDFKTNRFDFFEIERPVKIVPCV